MENNTNKANTDENDSQDESIVYANLGINGQPDEMNRGNDEATDTLLYTDNSTARNATVGLPNDDLGDMDNLSEDELDREISDLAEEEDAAGEPY